MPIKSHSRKCGFHGLHADQPGPESTEGKCRRFDAKFSGPSFSMLSADKSSPEFVEEVQQEGHMDIALSLPQGRDHRKALVPSSAEF
jgi:hypothetical protein